MPVKAFPIDEIEGKVKNVYEAIIIAAKRARQLNDLQMIQIRTLLENEELSDDASENLAELAEIDKMPKPVEVALDDLLEGKIQYEYLDKEEE